MFKFIDSFKKALFETDLNSEQKYAVAEDFQNKEKIMDYFELASNEVSNLDEIPKKLGIENKLSFNRSFSGFLGDKQVMLDVIKDSKEISDMIYETTKKSDQIQSNPNSEDYDKYIDSSDLWENTLNEMDRLNYTHHVSAILTPLGKHAINMRKAIYEGKEVKLKK